MKDKPFHDAIKEVTANLDEIQTTLIQCVEQGMLDTEDILYNRLLDLLDDASIVNNWDDLEELINQAKTLEQDIAAWLSLNGRTSYSYHWPSR
jgi:hypothetical protein